MKAKQVVLNVGKQKNKTKKPKLMEMSQPKPTKVATMELPCFDGNKRGKRNRRNWNRRKRNKRLSNLRKRNNNCGRDRNRAQNIVPAVHLKQIVWHTRPQDPTKEQIISVTHIAHTINFDSKERERTNSCVIVLYEQMYRPTAQSQVLR